MNSFVAARPLHRVIELLVRGKNRSPEYQLQSFETELLGNEIQPGMTVIDIGANVGDYTLLFSKLTGSTGRVFSFEPEPHNYEILQRKIVANARKNVTLINKAASDRSGSSFLYLSTDTLGNDRRIAIEMVRIDEVVPSPVNLIRMDVQGFEFRALLGMEVTIEAAPRLTLFTKFWPEGLRRAGSDPAEFLSWVRAAGFQIERIDERAKQLKRANEAELLQRYASPGAHTSLLCRKSAPCDP